MDFYAKFLHHNTHITVNPPKSVRTIKSIKCGSYGAIINVPFQSYPKKTNITIWRILEPHIDGNSYKLVIERFKKS